MTSHLVLRQLLRALQASPGAWAVRAWGDEWVVLSRDAATRRARVALHVRQLDIEHMVRRGLLMRPSSDRACLTACGHVMRAEAIESPRRRLSFIEVPA